LTCRGLLCVFAFCLGRNDLAGYVTTLIEIAQEMKCRLALDSIAARYARRLDTQRLSNRLGNGISNAKQSGL
jgi:hypothetical protein